MTDEKSSDRTMKAMQVRSPGAEFELVEIEVPQPGRDEVLIRVEACGVCHGEAVVKEGRFPGIKYPRIPGHEVIGIIDQLGSPSRRWKVGDRVGVGWHAGHCHQCPACRTGDFGNCEESLTTGLSVMGDMPSIWLPGWKPSLPFRPDSIRSWRLP